MNQNLKGPTVALAVLIVTAMIMAPTMFGTTMFGVAIAQQGESAATAGEQEEPKVKVERRDGKKVFRLTTTFVIEGRIQKPNAFYVLQRSQINYDWAKLKQDFVPRILESVRKSPF